MAQLKKQMEEINKKLNVILLTPPKQVINFFGKAIGHMENESIPSTIKELEKVRDDAIQPSQAYQSTEGQGLKTESTGYPR